MSARIANHGMYEKRSPSSVKDIPFPKKNQLKIPYK
jgi:hypothetical protein